MRTISFVLCSMSVCTIFKSVNTSSRRLCWTNSNWCVDCQANCRPIGCLCKRADDTCVNIDTHLPWCHGINFHAYIATLAFGTLCMLPIDLRTKDAQYLFCFSFYSRCTERTKHQLAEAPPLQLFMILICGSIRWFAYSTNTRLPAARTRTVAVQAGEFIKCYWKAISEIIYSFNDWLVWRAVPLYGWRLYLATFEYKSFALFCLTIVGSIEFQVSMINWWQSKNPGVEQSSSCLWLIHVVLLRGKQILRVFFSSSQKRHNFRLKEPAFVALLFHFLFSFICYCSRPIEHPELNRNLMQNQKAEYEKLEYFWCFV